MNFHSTTTVGLGVDATRRDEGTAEKGTMVKRTEVDSSTFERREFLAAVDRAESAARAYYEQGRLEMADGEYDALVAKVRRTRNEHGWQEADVLLGAVGAGTSQGGAAAHVVPMLSLENLFVPDDIVLWCERTADLAGIATGEAAFSVEPKYDGLSLAATYRRGQLVRIATRGDGRFGEDVTYASPRIVGLPTILSSEVDCEIRGEVIFTRSQFEAASEARMSTGRPAFVNPRNAASGTLRAETLDYMAELSFFAYGGVGIPQSSHVALLDAISRLGIQVGESDLQPRRLIGGHAVAAWVASFGELREQLEVDVDGAVIKLDDITAQTRVGETSRSPRWGIAFKYPALEATSLLLSVEWTVGRTGRITPRATIEPVFVAGTTVTYATLHNADDIRRKDLRIGDTVLVKRAGEVIPRIEAPLVDRRTGAEIEISVPERCPRCDGELDRTQLVWRCVKGRACGAKEAIVYAAGRDALDIEGLGDKVVAQLVDSGLVADVADVFTLTSSQLAQLDRLGEVSAANLMSEISRARTQPLSRVLTALGVRMTGRAMSRRLARHFVTMDALCKAGIADLCAVEGVGPERAETIQGELVELRSVIDRLSGLGVNLTEPMEQADSAPLSGKTVVVSGSVPGLTRIQANEWIERLGGKSAGSVSAKTDILITSETETTKAKKARELGIEIWVPERLMTLIEMHE